MGRRKEWRKKDGEEELVTSLQQTMASLLENQKITKCILFLILCIESASFIMKSNRK